MFYSKSLRKVFVTAIFMLLLAVTSEVLSQSYWMMRESSDGTIYYDVQVPPYFVTWLEKKNPNGETRTYEGNSWQFHPLNIAWDNNGSSPKRSGQIRINDEWFSHDKTQWGTFSDKLYDLGASKGVDNGTWTSIDGVDFIKTTGTSAPGLVLANHALGKTAIQSTTNGDKVAKNAVDMLLTSFSETEGKPASWWQVDLGKRYPVFEITLTVGWRDQLKDFILIFSDSEMPNAGLDYEPAKLEMAAVKAIRVTEGEKEKFRIKVPAVDARYVRVQRKAGAGGMPLGLKDVSIIGNPNPATSSLPSKKTWAELLDMGKPFDADKDMQYYNVYRQGPKVVALPEGSGQLDIVWEDNQSGKTKFSRYSNLNGTGSTKVWVKDVPSQLDQLGGFAKDGSGNSFVLTYKKENLTDPSTKNITGYRPDIAKMLKLNSSGGLVWEKDINNATYSDIPFCNPVNGGTSRLVFGNGKLGYITAKNYIDWDPAVNGRHQHALRRIMDTNGNAVTTSGGYHGHSFDQRIMFDGSNFITLDRQEWGILMTKLPASGSIPGEAVRPVFTHLLQNNGQDVYATLGDVAKGSNGYVVAFSAEQGDENSKLFNRPRDMAILHVVSNFDQITPKDNFPGSDQSIIVRSTVADTKSMNGEATAERDLPIDGTRTRKTAGIVWLTNYASGSGGNFETALRPKMVKVSSDRYVLVWEKWQVTNNNPSKYLTTMAMVIDESGKIEANAKDIGHKRLDPDDDAFLFNGKAAWVIGDAQGMCFRLYTLDSSLGFNEYKLDL